MVFDCPFCQEQFPTRKELDFHTSDHIDIEISKHYSERLNKSKPGSVDGYFITDFGRDLMIPENPLAPFEEFSNTSILPYADMNTIEEVTSLELPGLYLTSFQESDKFQPWKLNSLEKLDLSFNFIKQLDSISCISTLVEFRARKNLINDLNPISHLKRLQILDLGENSVEDLEPVKFLKQLRILLIDENLLQSLISVLNTLMEIDDLEDLYIEGNPFYNNTLNSFDWIASAVKVKRLNGTKISSYNNSLTYKQVFRLRKALHTEDESERLLKLTTITHMSTTRTLRGSDNNFTLFINELLK